MQAEKNARGLTVEGDILGFMKKWGGSWGLGTLGRLEVPGTLDESGVLRVPGPWGLGGGSLGSPKLLEGPRGSPPCVSVR